MPIDYLVYLIVQPLGLVLIGATISVSYFLWRLVLGKVYKEVGIKPLLIAYACALVGHVIASFVSSYADFSSRVAAGILPESDRWPWLLYATSYISILFLIFVLPLISFLGVPFAALLIRLRRLTYGTIAASAIGLWLTLSLAMWYIEVYNMGARWESAHPIETLIRFLTSFLPGILFVAVPFLLAVHLASHFFRQAKTEKMQNIT